MAGDSGRLRFDGGAATYRGTGILAFLITVFTLGIGYPFALVLRERWWAKRVFIDGRRLLFTGSAVGAVRELAEVAAAVRGDAPAIFVITVGMSHPLDSLRIVAPSRGRGSSYGEG